MKSILSISLDNNLFSKKSTDSYERQVFYAKYFKNLTMIVYTTQKFEKIVDGNLTIIPTNSKNLIQGFFDYIKISKSLKNKGENFEIVTSQDPFFLGLTGLKLSKIFNANFRPQLHIEAFSNKYWRRESILNYIQYLIGLYVIKKTDKIRVVSKRSVNYLNKKSISNEFIPVSTNFKKFNIIKSASKDIDIIYVGRFVKQKNLSFFLKVLFELKKNKKKLKVYFVGDGPLKNNLIKKINRLGLQENIVFTGFVNHDKLNEYYNRSKVFVLPSLYEGWGLVAIEASLAGVPVIMSNTGCAGEIIIDSKSGFVCKINDKNEFVNKTLNYLNDSKLRNNFANEAKKNCEVKLNQKYLIGKLIDFLNGK